MTLYIVNLNSFEVLCNFIGLEQGFPTRAVASLTVPGGQEFHFPQFFSNFDQFFLIFPQTLLIFFLIMALRVGKSPTRKGPGYATVSNLRPAGCMRPARQYCVAREVIYILIVLDELIKEMMKPESTLLQPSAQLIHCSCYNDGFYSRNSLENL